jgi:hypothetical protein
MKWKIKEKEFRKIYPGYELNDDHTIIEHNGNIIHAANGSTPKIYKQSDDIVFDVRERIGDKQVNWQLFISFDELRPLLMEYDSNDLPVQNNIVNKDSGAATYVQRINQARIDSGGPSARLSY